LISYFIKTNLPFVFIPGFLLGMTYLVYQYCASLSIPEWVRLTKKELD